MNGKGNKRMKIKRRIMVFQIIFKTQIFIHHDDVANSPEARHVESPPFMGTRAKIKLTVSKLTSFKRSGF